jgi:tRNA A-37 threonylcarbamoyl transferase component Bud32
MTRYFALAYGLFVAALLILLGLGDSKNDNYSQTIYGYGRFNSNAVYFTLGLLGLAAWWNFVQWRKSGTGPASTSIHFVLAHVWYALGVALILGTWTHPLSNRRASLFGYGYYEYPPVYLANAVAFIASFVHLRWWRTAGRPGVTESIHFGLANAWFLAAVVIVLGIGDHRDSGRYATIFGYGKLEEIVPYLAVGFMMFAAIGNFRARRFAADAPPRPEPVAREAGTDSDWKRRLVYAVTATAIGAMFGATLLISTKTERVPQPVFMGQGIGDGERNPFLPPQGQPVAGRPMWIVAFPILVAVLTVGFLFALLSRKRSNRSPLASAADGTPSPSMERVEAPRPPRVCPQCRAPIAVDAPQGLCPRCLMAGAFQSILNPNRTSPYAGSLEPPTPEDVQEFFPHLEILGLIGAGGMGAVYQARQPNLDRVVALKLIRPREDNPTFAERFVREAKAMAKLTHPNIVTIFESGEAGGSLYLIMEYIDGVTLREAIRAKAVQPADAMKIVGQLCDALEYAHSQGVVHRDIKPENILLDRTGKVKVVDFGLAKLADDNAMSLTHTRQAMGTPHYMAPEQWEKPTEVDHRADIYALGVVIYELLTGELPLGRFDPPSVKSRLDARIDEIVLKLLAKEPDRRYQRASDVRTALFGIGDLEVEATIRRHNHGDRRVNFYEFRTKQEFLGWPIVHIVRGIDPKTGTRRIAKGWIALGDYFAVGFLALAGLVALGPIALAGVLGLGLFALAGSLATGGLAIGGTAVGFFALGGIALGWLAVGGVAVGKYALGGTVVGTVTNKHGAISNLPERMWADISSWF